MTPRTITWTLVGAEVLAAAVALGLHIVVRPDILEMTRELGVAPSPMTRVALSPGLLPGACALGALLTIAAFTSRTRARMGRLLALAITIVGLAVVIATWGYFVPIFERA